MLPEIEAYGSAKVRVYIYAPNLDLPPVRKDAAVGGTIVQVLEEVGVAPWAMGNGQARVYIEDNVDIQSLVPRDEWMFCPVEYGQSLYVEIPLEGGGNFLTGLISVLSLALAIAVPYLAPAAWGLTTLTATGAGVATTLTNAGLAVSGGILLAGSIAGTLLAPPQPQLSSGADFGGSEDTNVFQGGRNEYRPLEPLTQVFGLVRTTLPYAARTYTEFIGDEQYLRMIFDAVGPLKCHEIRIGETVVTNDDDDVEIEILDGWPSDAAPTLFTNTVQEDRTSIDLDDDVNWKGLTTEECDEFNFDVFLPSLFLLKKETGSYRHTSTSYKYRWRVAGSDDAWNEKDVTIRSYSKKPFARNVRVKPPARGSFEIEWLLTGEPSGDVDDLYYSRDMQVISLRSVLNESPFDKRYTPSHHFMVAMRVRMSDRFSGLIDQVNFLLESYYQVYDGQNWNWQLSRSPAWARMHALIGPGNDDPMPVSMADVDRHVAFDEFCSLMDFEFNYALTSLTATDKFLGIIDGAALASGSRRNNLVSVDWDAEKPVQGEVYTQRNSWGFTDAINDLDHPHVIYARFQNAAQDYEWDELPVYADGYDESNATKIERTTIRGAVYPEQVYKITRHWMADANLRPETFSWNVGLRGLKRRRGDRVGLQHPEILIGQGPGARIHSWGVDGQLNVTDVKLDQFFDLDENTLYGLVISTFNGERISQTVNESGGRFNTFSFVEPIPAGTGIEGGEGVAFGPATMNVLDVIITRIEPGKGLSFKLTGKEYAPDVFRAYDGPIPLWQSNITFPATRRFTKPSPPEIVNALYDANSFTVLPSGELVPQIDIYYRLPVNPPLQLNRVESQFRVTDGTWQEGGRTPVIDGARVVSIDGAPEDQLVDIRIRVVDVYEQPSEWVSAVNFSLPESRPDPPPQPTGLAIAVEPNGFVLSWDRSQSLYIAGYDVFVDGERETAGLAGTSHVHACLFTAGTYRFGVASRDRWGQVGPVNEVTFTIYAPGPVKNLQPSTNDNFVLFYYELPEDGTLEVKEVELRKGQDFASAKVLGRKSGTFTSWFEPDGGVYTYWLVPVDVAGNYGAPVKRVMVVDDPPNYTLLLNREFDFSQGVKSNVLKLPDGRALAPYPVGRTLRDLINITGATTFRDLRNQGHDYLFGPIPAAANYEEVEHDYGALISTTIQSVINADELVAGGNILTHIGAKELQADPWTEQQANSVQSQGFRYVRSRFEINSDGFGFFLLNEHRLKLQSRTLQEIGKVVISEAQKVAGVAVPFSQPFVDVITFTPPVVLKPNTLEYEVLFEFDDVANPTGFIVRIVRKSDGKPFAGTVGYGPILGV
jgi:hypothetical protein